MNIQGLLRKGGRSLLLLSAVVPCAAWAGGLPQTINLPGSKPQPVIHMNAPPQPATPGRFRTHLPAPAPGVYQQNAPGAGNTSRVHNCVICG